MYTKIQPANQWGWTESLLNKTANLLEMIIWQNSNVGVKKSKQSRKPEPYFPDFIQEKKAINKDAELHTVDEVRQILALPRG